MHFNTAILPWGATEALNYHLPYGTDTILAGYLAEESAALAWEKGTRLLFCPPFPRSQYGQLEVPFCMNMNPSTQMALLEDVITVLLRTEWIT
jgi:creatinine amidohydrolase